MKAIYYLGSEASGASVRLFADSAIGRDVMPIFVPEGFDNLQLSVCVAVRIGRLGKGIAPKFASRYVDAISLVGVLGSPLHTALLSITDGAVTTGKWVDCELPAMPEIKVEINGAKRCIDTSQLAIPQAIADISTYAMLKTGDIIILDASATTFDVESDGAAWRMHSHSPDYEADPPALSCSILGTPVLHLRLK